MATVTQSHEALERANTIRMERAALRRRVRSGDLLVSEVLAWMPDCVRTLPLGALLRWQDRWGDRRVERFSTRVGVSELRRAGDLPVRQCMQVARGLGQLELVADQFVQREAAEFAAALGLCPLLGSVRCVRPTGHADGCVMAVFAARLHTVFFRWADSMELVCAVELPRGSAAPSLRQVAEIFAGRAS